MIASLLFLLLKGEFKMTVLSGMEIDRIVEIIDYLVNLQDYKVSVGEVKKKFGLTNEEYNMIYDLAMPAIRQSNGMRFYRFYFRSIAKEIDAILNYIINNPKKLDISELFTKVKERLIEASLKAEEIHKKHGLGLEDMEEIEEAS